jgi:hypothetical protein
MLNDCTKVLLFQVWVFFRCNKVETKNKPTLDFNIVLMERKTKIPADLLGSWYILKEMLFQRVDLNRRNM